MLKMDPTASFGETDEEGVSLKLVEKNLFFLVVFRRDRGGGGQTEAGERDLGTNSQKSALLYLPYKTHCVEDF